MNATKRARQRVNGVWRKVFNIQGSTLVKMTNDKIRMTNQIQNPKVRMGHRVKDSGRKLKETGFSYKDQGATHKTIFHMIPGALHLNIFEQPHGGTF
jgi:hypothetical protein